MAQKWYNLLGQWSWTKGDTNPDATDAGPYIYTTPPGRGDNKGVVKTSFGSLGAVDKKGHKEKLKEEGFEVDEVGAVTKQPAKSYSIPGQPELDIKPEDDKPSTLNEVINNLLRPTGLGEIESRFDISPDTLIRQLNNEQTYIENFIKNTKERLKAEEEVRNPKSEMDKETEYIKNFIKEKIDSGPGDLEAETEYIKNFVENIISNKKEEEVIDIVSGGDLITGDDDVTGDDDESGGGQQGGGQQGGGQEGSGDDTGGGQASGGEQQEGNAGDIYDFLNIPEGAYLWDVDGTNYIVYEVPGSDGELYKGNPIFMAYEVQENDVVKAGIYSPEAPSLTGSPVSKIFFDKIAIVTGNTDQLSADIDNPFASFVETIGEQALVAPWIKDPEMISLIAEAAVEGRVVTDAEWQVTNWYQENNETQREWLRTYYSDPSTAAQLTTDSQLAVANSLQASGVSNAPEALINWVAGRYVSGEWSDAYTTEQIALFADPYAQGKRDAQFETYLSSTAITGVDRTTAREREVEELFATWLGPTLGKLTDQEKSEMAGRLRDDPDYKDTLIGSLKQSRLAAFSNYTNPELTYDDIARPWRNLTTSVWGQTADETQGWWQEMVKSNDFATAQTTLREKGLENNVTQVTQDATQALTQALSQGQVSQGVNQ